MTRLFVDMDGTLAEFKAADTLETLYEEGYFSKLAPNINVVDAVNMLSRDSDVEIFIMSAVLTDSKYALQEKNEWIDRYLPQIDSRHRIFPPCGEDKKSYIPGSVRESDCLLDDYTHNLTAWQPPAKGIKLLNGINNTHGTWQGNRLDYRKSGAELADDLKKILSGEVIVDNAPPHPLDDRRVIDLIATYEEECNIPDEEAVTFYYGDLGMHCIKPEVKRDGYSKIGRAYDKALSVMAMDNRAFKAAYDPYHGRSTLRKAIVERINGKGYIMPERTEDKTKGRKTVKPMVNYTDNPQVIRNMSEDLIVDMVYEDGLRLANVPRERQTDAVKRTAVAENGFALRYVYEQDDETCHVALQENGMALQYVYIKTQDMEMAAVAQNGMALQYVYEQDRTWDMCAAAFASNKGSVSFMPVNIQKCFAAAYEKVLSDDKDLEREYKEKNRFISNFGIRKWIKANYDPNCIYTINSDGDVAVINKKLGNFVHISNERIYQETEELLRDGYPKNNIVGKIVYQNGEELIYLSANAFYKDIEDADAKGIQISLTLSTINGCSIDSSSLNFENFDNVLGISTVKIPEKIIEKGRNVPET